MSCPPVRNSTVTVTFYDTSLSPVLAHDWGVGTEKPLEVVRFLEDMATQLIKKAHISIFQTKLKDWKTLWRASNRIKRV